jgi:hypothetical protein
MKALLVSALALALAPRAADAQAAASLAPAPRLQFFDSAGRPLAGGCVQTYQAGSTTPLATYNNASGASANPNPVILDSSGRADIWLLAGSAYKFTVSAATPGCLGNGTLLYTTDNIIDQGFSLAHALAAGTLAIGLRSSPATGAGGGVGPGNALLSATTAGLYVSVNGAAPVLLNGGGGSGSAGGPTNSVQYNSGSGLGGSANLTWNNSTNSLAVCASPATGCTATSGVEAPAFSSSAPNDTTVAYTTAGGTFTIRGNGDGLFQDLSVSKTFNSLATGSTSAIQQANGTFTITGAGNAGFQSMGLGLQSSPLTGLGGGTGAGSALLSATTAGLYLSLNGNPPALLSGGGGSGSPGAPTNSLQYNNAGAFGGSANLTFNPTTGVITACPSLGTGCSATSGFQAPAFSSSATGAATAFTTSGGTFTISGGGDGLFQDLSVTKTFNSLATGTTPAIQQSSGTFSITGAGNAGFQSTALGLQSAPLTGLGGGTGAGNAMLSATTAGLYISLNGAAPVLLTGGGGGTGTPGGPASAIQYNNAGTFAGSANLEWNSSTNTVTVTGASTAGFQGPAFSSSATGTNPAFTTSAGTFQISGNGNAQFQNTTVTTTFNSLATGSTVAIQQANGTFNITGAGNAGFQSTALGLQGTPLTGLGGGTGAGNAMLSATTAGLWLSVNGAAPALLAAGGAPGAPANSIQFNSSGAFGGSANLTWNNSTNVVAVSGASTAGFQGPAFSSSATGTNPAFTTAGGTFTIQGNGTASFQSIALTNGITVGNGFYGITTAGALTVSSCSGCSAGVTSWNTRTGAVTLTKQDVTGVTQALGTGDSPTFASITVSSCSGCGGGVTSWNSRTGAVSLTKTDVTNVEGQGLGTADNVTFNGVSANQYTGGTYAGTLFNCTDTGTTNCMQQSSGQFQIHGSGWAAFQSICVSAANATVENCTFGWNNAGDAWFHNIYAASVNAPSDLRLKENIRSIPDSLAGILKLRPVTFDWRKDHEHGIGFIAQEVRDVFPQLVTNDQKGYLALEEIGLIPELVKAVQQLAARVATLEAGRR